MKISSASRFTSILLVLSGLALLAIVGLVAAGGTPAVAQGQAGRQLAAGSSSQPQPASQPATADAFAHWVIGGTSPTEITVTVGTPVVLDLLINTGSNQDVTAAQNYLTFTHQLFQVVNSGLPGCVLTSTLTPDLSTFDVTLQNEVCNGPGQCNFRGLLIDPGSIAFASGALANCPTGCGGDFRIASMGICGSAPGRGLIHWQFSPPAPPNRDTEIVSLPGDLVHNPALYHDVYVNVVSGAGTPTATPTQCAINFSDVHESDYFYTAVQYLFCHGAISGYADGTFRPYNNTTRGQLSKIVVLAEGWPIVTPTGTPTFRDVPTSNPFFGYIETAYAQNIISGYSCGTGCLEFLPGNNITRGQLSKVVVLAEGWTLVNRTVPTFSDVPPGSAFFAYVETAYCHGIISGYGDGTFRPGNSATRGQIAKIVYEAIAGGHACAGR